MTRTLYRIVRTEVPTVSDFRSYEAEGRRLSSAATEQVRRKWNAVSTFDSIALAARRARDLALGDWIAELAVPDVVPREDSRPTPQGRPLGRHVSVWATPEQLLGYVVRVVALKRVQS